MHPLVKLAKEAVEQYVRTKKIISSSEELIPEMNEKAGVFVSIKKKGQLRGCIGTFSSTTNNTASEIIQNAVSAATQDPRFPPVGSNELDELEYSVDVLTEPEKIKSKSYLDPKKYGVIVKSGERRGLLLPDLEGVNTIEEQVDIARRKGAIRSYDPIKLYRFEVIRYK